MTSPIIVAAVCGVACALLLVYAIRPSLRWLPLRLPILAAISAIVLFNVVILLPQYSPTIARFANALPQLAPLFFMAIFIEWMVVVKGLRWHR